MYSFHKVKEGNWHHSQLKRRSHVWILQSHQVSLARLTTGNGCQGTNIHLQITNRIINSSIRRLIGYQRYTQMRHQYKFQHNYFILNKNMVNMVTTGRAM